MLYFLIFIFGLSVGSFLNVVICRLETGESIISSRSHCPQCGAVLKWYDLIPLLSFIFLFGKCRFCRKKISWQYPAVEIATGLLFLSVILSVPSVILSEAKNLAVFIQDPSLTLRMIFYLITICFLIIIFVYDLRHYIISDKIVLPAITIAFIYQLSNLYPNPVEEYKLLIPYLLAALGASLFFLSLVLFSRGKWMGMGDVKLAFLMGLILGWPNILTALFLAFFSGAIIGVALIIFGKKGLKSQIPFGPFLSGATILVMLCGQYSVNWIAILVFK